MLCVSDLFNHFGRRARDIMPDPGTLSFWADPPRLTEMLPQVRHSGLAWEWVMRLPAEITATYACAPDGPCIVGCADGSVRRIEPSGEIRWIAEHPGMKVTAVTSSADAGVTAAVLTPSSETVTPGLAAVRVLDGTGRPLWRVLCSAPDRKIEGRVSSDGASVLILRAAEPHSPALVSLRDASTGVVRWERRTRNAPGIVAETSPDLRSVVVGYEIRHSENEAPTGLIESYRDGRLVSSVVPDEPVQPAMLGTDSIALLDPEGWVECREWTDCAIGTERWSARGKAGSVAYSRGTTLVVYSCLDEQFDTGVTVVSVIDAFHADGTNVVHKEYTGTAPYIPTLSSDGRVLALVPRKPRYSEPPALVRLTQPERTMTLPLGVATIDFGVGNDLMLVGMVDGTLGIARVPF